MSITYYQNQISQIEKDIADLYKKIAEENKREIDKNKQIDSVNRSVTKNTSLSTLQSKQRQIQGYQNDIYNIKKKIADYQKKVADKSTDLNRRKAELRKAEENERKKIQQEQVNFKRQLEQDIQKQKLQLDSLIKENYSVQKNASSENNYSLEDKVQVTYDFFISHASDDKDEIVRELAEVLIENGFKVWYDDFQLKVGDSLRKKIDEGLVNSRYGIVIISPSFITKGWPEYELNGMVAREMNGHQVILPIWHKVTKDEVLKYSPTLADKLALNTSVLSVKEIVEKLKEFK